MQYGNFEEKSKEYYAETFKTEISHKLGFYKADIRNHQKNKAKLEDEIKEEDQYIRACETEIATIEAKLNNPDEQAKRLLFRDFKAAINNILNGEEGQLSARFGLKIQRQGPFIIQKPFSITREGKKVTETKQVAVTKHRNNEEALNKFRDYLRGGYNWDLGTMTFEQLKDGIEKFFSDAPKPDVYGEEYETETFVSDSVKVGNNLFRI